MSAALNRVLPRRRGKSAAAAISTRRESISTPGESKPTNPTLIALARRQAFRAVIERTSASDRWRRCWLVRSNVRLAGNLANAGCPVLQVEGIGLDVMLAPKPEPRIVRYELTNVEWAECDAGKERAPRAKRIRGVVAQLG